MMRPSTSPIAQPVRQCAVALNARRLSETAGREAGSWAAGWATVGDIARVGLAGRGCGRSRRASPTGYISSVAEAPHKGATDTGPPGRRAAGGGDVPVANHRRAVLYRTRWICR